MPSTEKGSYELVDFSDRHFDNNLPPQRGGKFVLIKGGGALYLVLSPKGLDTYHANIVERFCLFKGGVSGSFSRGREYYRLDEPGWSVQGGGYWVIDEASRAVRFAGESKAYGWFDRGVLKECVSRLGEFEGFGVEVE